MPTTVTNELFAGSARDCYRNIRPPSHDPATPNSSYDVFDSECKAVPRARLCGWRICQCHCTTHASTSAANNQPWSRIHHRQFETIYVSAIRTDSRQVMAEMMDEYSAPIAQAVTLVGNIYLIIFACVLLFSRARSFVLTPIQSTDL